jgi:N-methylhydantoinase B
VVSAVKPAPMRWWMTFPMTIVDTIFKAMAPVMPERVIAGHHADLCIANINGISPRERRLFIGILGPLGGGWGAKLREDGVSATVCLNDGDTHNSPVEQLEAKYPLLVERHALVPDSGGPGRQRGGLGIERASEARSPMNFNAQVDRVHCRPWGLDGGMPGSGNKVMLRRDGRLIDDFPNAKVLSVVLKPGDACVMRSGGGGGFGDPTERPAERVAEDVRQGYVSRESAERDYGAVVDDAGTLDAEATRARRAAMAGTADRAAGE